MIADLIDRLSAFFLNPNGPLTPVFMTFTSYNTFMKTREHSNVRFGMNRSLYMSVFEEENDERQSRGTLFHIHGGFFTDFTRYDVLQEAYYIARALKYRIVSPDFRLANFGNTVADSCADIRLAWEYTVRTWKQKGPILVYGVSSSGIFITDCLADRLLNSATAVFMDSPVLCITGAKAETYDVSEVCGSSGNRWQSDERFPNPYCAQQLQPLPTFVARPTSDVFVSTESYKDIQYNASLNQRECITMGLHGSTLTITCMNQFVSWAIDVFGMYHNVDRLQTLSSLMLTVTSSTVTGALLTITPNEVLCKQSCGLLTEDSRFRKPLYCDRLF